MSQLDDLVTKIQAIEKRVNLMWRLEIPACDLSGFITGLSGDVTAQGPGTADATITAAYFERLMDELFRNRRFMLCDFQSYDYWTSAVTGSGAVTVGIHNNSMATGATNGSTAVSYATTGAFGMGQAEFAFFGCISTAVTTCAIRAVMTTGTTVGATTEHMGFNIINGHVEASNGDGAAGTQTAAGVDLVAGVFNSLRIVSDSAIPDIKFYVGGVLVATHTTNLPTYAGHRPLFHITNTAAAARTFRVNQVLYRTTADFV